MLYGFGSSDGGYGSLFDDALAVGSKIEKGVKSVEQAVQTGKATVSQAQASEQALEQQLKAEGQRLKQVASGQGMPAGRAPLTAEQQSGIAKMDFSFGRKAPGVSAQTRSLPSRPIVSSTQAPQTPVVQVPKSNMYLYLGIGALALGGVAYFFLSKKPAAVEAEEVEPSRSAPKRAKANRVGLIRNRSCKKCGGHVGAQDPGDICTSCKVMKRKVKRGKR